MKGLQRILLFDNGYPALEDWDFWLLEDVEKMSFFMLLTRNPLGRVSVLGYDKQFYSYEELAL